MHDWDEPVTAQAGGATFYDGDPNGISEKLPYLRKPGVTALYLNPVFKASSVHKYGTEDYRHVDLQFGGDGVLPRLRYNTQQLGIRLVPDGVFNHGGDSHAWLDRHNRGTGGICRSPKSLWCDWYSFSDDGMALDWLGYVSLPKLDYQLESLTNEIYCREDSIVRHRLKAPWNMDDWRLDVVRMLGEAGGARSNLQYVAGIIETAKETQSNVYVVGEHFGDARQWLQADVGDAAMNYRGSTFPSWGFLANTDISYDPQQIDAQTRMAWMDNYRAGLPHQQRLHMFNQLDGHDTARFKALLGWDIVRLSPVVVWLSTWPGVPCIYYDDEVGLDGKSDPSYRKPFPRQMEKQGSALFALYQRMIALRKKGQVLCCGDCWVLYAEDNVVVLVRVLNQQCVLVVVNRSEACEVVLPASPLFNVA